MAKGYTTTELNEIRDFYLKDLLTVEEIAELTGRTPTAIKSLSTKMNWHRDRIGHRAADIIKAKKVNLKVPEENETPKTKVEDSTPVVTKSLSDFTPREIIKHMYRLGYRIEDNQLVCIVKQKVNVKDIIEN